MNRTVKTATSYHYLDTYQQFRDHFVIFLMAYVFAKNLNH